MRLTISKPTTPASKEPILKPISNLHKKQISLEEDDDDVKLEVLYEDALLCIVVVTLIYEYNCFEKISYMSAPC